jgi:hypothetical protein
MSPAGLQAARSTQAKEQRHARLHRELGADNDEAPVVVIGAAGADFEV